ncbi:MAG: glycine zipper family protein [Alphaproteobacteria bacterium]|nr:glycine zipper family protein [Alphaproteobacteria bacterium]
MKVRIAAMAGISALVLLGGCGAVPDGPTIPMMPAKGKAFSQFQREDSECQDYAANRVAGRARAANDRAVATAVIGAALGAGLGAAVGGGRAVGEGAAVGGIIGTSIGANDARFSERTLQGRYNIAYAQCMDSYGNHVADEDGPPRYDRRYDNYPPPPPPPPGY